MRIPVRSLIGLPILGALMLAPPLASGATPVTICLALPKAQLGQGVNSGTDVSEPVRTALTSFMAGPATQIVNLEARIPLQIAAEAEQKMCQFVLQSSVVQKKGGSGVGFLKAMAPLAGALPMVGGFGGLGGSMSGALAASAVSSVATQAAAQSMQQDYMEAMTGAQQSNIKSGDTITVEYSLNKMGDAATLKSEQFKAKAKANGEDVLSPLLEQVATAVVGLVSAT